MEVFTPPVVPEKRPPGRQPKYSEEYMMMVVRKVTEEGMSYREAASTFKTSHGSISAWIKKYKHVEAKTKRNKQKSKYKDRVEDYRHQAQLKELKHEIAELYLENVMLKKALKHSLEKKKESSSVITSENLAQLNEDVR